MSFWLKASRSLHVLLIDLFNGRANLFDDLLVEDILSLMRLMTNLVDKRVKRVGLFVKALVEGLHLSHQADD